MVGFFGVAYPVFPRTAVIGGFAHPAYLSRRTCSVAAPVCRESGVVTTLQGVDSVPRVVATNQFGARSTPDGADHTRASVHAQPASP